MFEQAEKLFDEEKYDEALKIYRRLESQSHAEAIYSIGWCYEYGLAVEQNYVTAIEKYKTAFSLGHIKSAKRIGFCYLEGGYGIEQDFKKAVAWLEKAAAKGIDDIYFTIGNIYRDNLDDQDSAKVAYEKGVEHSEADCYAGLSSLCLGQVGKLAEAIELAEKADASGSIPGTLMLYLINKTCFEYEKAFDNAVKLFRASSGQEDKITDLAESVCVNDCGADAAIRLAKKYYEGVDGKIYYQEAQLCLSYAIHKMNNGGSVSGETRFNILILSAKLYLDPKYENYDVNNGIIILKECIQHPDCDDEIRLLYVKNLYKQKKSLPEAQRILEQLVKNGYPAAVEFSKENQKHTSSGSSINENRETGIVSKENPRDLRKKYMSLGLCSSCGCNFKGFFVKTCIKCGKRKDY